MQRIGRPTGAVSGLNEPAALTTHFWHMDYESTTISRPRHSVTCSCALGLNEPAALTMHFWHIDYESTTISRPRHSASASATRSAGTGASAVRELRVTRVSHRWPVCQSEACVCS